MLATHPWRPLRTPITLASLTKASPSAPCECGQRGKALQTMAEQARILVVDDEPAVQNALSRALSLERYDVAQAVDGREALERLGTAAYEVVILDISMPHVDGLEVCRRLREGGD